MEVADSGEQHGGLKAPGAGRALERLLWWH